jgi:trehalose synthase-fused probable maltokinase
MTAGLSQPELLEQLRAARWFGGKSRGIRALQIADRVQWAADDELALVKVAYDVGAPETYVMANRFPDASVARALLQQFDGATLRTRHGGELRFCPTHVLRTIDARETEPVTTLRGEQSNTSVRFGTALILKLFRRLQFGPNPDVEISRYLTEHTTFRGTPAVVGSLEYANPEGETASLALLQRFEVNRGDGWTTTLRRLDDVLAGADRTESINSMRRLASTTAELHVALAHGAGDFSSEAIDDTDVRTWHAAVVDELRYAANALRHRSIQVDEARLRGRADGIATLRGSKKTRHHGDYHLGQVLERTDGEFVIIDFEGEPAKPLALRREKRSPLRDVAGMLRSFDYARNSALRSHVLADPTRAAAWYIDVRRKFLDTYFEVMTRDAPDVLPPDPHPALAALELEKAAYEVLYELNNRPAWLPIPLAALSG